MHFTITNSHLVLFGCSKFCPYIQNCPYNHGPYKGVSLYYPTPIDINREAFLPLAKWIGVSVALQSRVRVRVRRLVRAWHFRCCQPLSLPPSPPSLPLILYWPFGPFTHCRPAQSCCQSHSEYTTIEDWFPRSGWGAH